MGHAQSFIGRERELAQLALIIGPGDDGLRLGMLRGPSGAGKTTLVRVAVEQARQSGYDVAMADGRAGSLSTPLAPWYEALPELRESLAEAGAVDIDRAAAELIALLAARTAEQPLLLVFDDAQSLDETSIALLTFATGVSERMNLSILLVEQTDAVDVPASYRNFADTLLARRFVQHLDLGALADEAIAGIIRAVMGVAEDVEIPMELVIRAEGNPWFAKELAEAFVHGDDEIPVNIAAAAMSRLSRLDEVAQDLVHAIALCPEGAHISWLELLSDQKALEFARTMTRIKDTGLIRERENIVAIAHPLMRQAFLDELSAAMRRAMHLELARVAGDVTELGEVLAARAQAYHLSQAGKPDEAVAHFTRAAQLSEEAGQLHDAFADYQRALDAEPRIERRVDLLQVCGRAAMQISAPGAGQIWAELVRLASARRDDATYAYALVQQHSASNEGSSTERLDRAVSLGPDRYGWSARAAALLCLQEANYEGLLEHERVALELARTSDDPLLELTALWNLGLGYSELGQLGEAIEHLEQAAVAATQMRMHERAVFARLTLVDALIDNLDHERALVECESVLRYVEEFGLERLRPIAEAFLGASLVLSGDLRGAVRHVERGLASERRFQPAHFTGVVWLIRAQVSVEAGDMANGRSFIDAAISASEEAGWTSWVAEGWLALARFLAMQGQLDEALDVARRLDLEEEALMARLALWLTRAGVLHERADYLELSSSVRERLRMQTRLSRIIGAEIDATVGVTDGDVAGLDQVVEQWRSCGRALDAAHAAMSAAVLVRSADPEAGLARLSDVRTSMMEMDASWEADCISGILRKMGVRSRSRSTATEVANLTKRELEIAQMVASGLRNSDVAGQLFLSEKTVAAHLSKIYSKLGMRSRVELSTWVAEQRQQVG